MEHIAVLKSNFFKIEVSNFIFINSVSNIPGKIRIVC